MNTLIKTLFFIFSLTGLFGCAIYQAPQDNFMKNTPTQMKVGKLPYSHEVGIIYET